MLDVGSGSGYFTALMATMMTDGFVYGIDHIKELTEMSLKNISKNHSNLLDDGRIILQTGNGFNGLPQYAPFDCIHIGAFVKEIPRKLLEQLAVNGRMVINIFTMSKNFIDMSFEKEWEAATHMC